MIDKTFRKSTDVAHRMVDNEAVIVIPDKGLVRVLNETGARIWELLDGVNKVEDIVNIIADEFDTSETQAKKDVVDFISELETKGMVI